MAITNLGRVRFHPRGDYNPAADPLYSLLDLVSDGGGSFVYINDTPSNEPTSSTSHWQQITEQGLKGDTGAKIVSAAWSGNDMLLTLDDASTVTLTGAKTTLKGDPGDISNIKVDGATKTKAAGVVDLTSDFARYALWRKTASGNPVSVYPVPESPLYPKVSGTFTQDGTGDPSPTNIRELHPWLTPTTGVRGGKNLIDKTTLLLDMVLTYDGQESPLSNRVITPFISVSIGTEYSVSRATADWMTVHGYTTLDQSSWVSQLYDSASSGSFVIPSNVHYIRIKFDCTPSTLALTDNIQLELGSTATIYEPYRTVPQTVLVKRTGNEPYTESEITLTAPQEITAGWMDNEAKGGVAGIKATLNGSETWDDTNFVASGYFETTLAAAAHATPGLACSHFLPAASAAADSNKAVLVGTSLKIYPADTVATNKTAWLAYLTANPVTIAYTLETEVSITPTAAPLSSADQLDRITPRQNVLTASTGNIELTYAKSPIRESDDIATAIAAL